MNTAVKEMGPKFRNVQEFKITKRSCTKQSKNERIGLLQVSTEYRIFGKKSLEVHGVQY